MNNHTQNTQAVQIELLEPTQIDESSVSIDSLLPDSPAWAYPCFRIGQVTLYTSFVVSALAWWFLWESRPLIATALVAILMFTGLAGMIAMWIGIFAGSVVVQSSAKDVEISSLPEQADFPQIDSSAPENLPVAVNDNQLGISEDAV